MKLLEIAISSIVDANTGYLVERKSNEIDYKLETQRAHEIRSKSVLQLAQGIKTLLAPLKTAIEAHLKKRKTMAKLNRLSDHLLQDIGISQEDLRAFEAGVINADELRPEFNAQSVSGVKPVPAHALKTQRHIPAANDILFNKECCA
ncbi:MAG: DUF1127 domain-containing protein [Pseudomonadota bacterium]